MEDQGEGLTKFKGIRKRKSGKWVSEIRIPKCKERIWLGTHDTPEKAARAFDVALFCLRGRGATTFNFPDNLPNIVVSNSLTRAEIQKIAAKYANGEVEEQHKEEVEEQQHKEEEEEDMTINHNSIRSNNDKIDWDFMDCLLSVPEGMGNALSAADFGVNGCAV